MNEYNTKSVADYLGQWVDPNFDSGLIERLRNAWAKPLSELTNSELATFLRQNILTEHILLVAQSRLKNDVDDETEIFDGELAEAVVYAKNRTWPPPTV
jgi:hypothetical protein